jgi:hypothetical protein
MPAGRGNRDVRPLQAGRGLGTAPGAARRAEVAADAGPMPRVRGRTAGMACWPRIAGLHGCDLQWVARRTFVAISGPPTIPPGDMAGRLIEAPGA